MYQECPAKLKMKRQVLNEGFFDDASYHCKIITYNPEEENIYLLIGKTELPLFSLDAEYECLISVGEEILKCNGMIIERYVSKLGKVVVFHLKNGFYKNLVN
ncbi:MAG: hypothetical protein ACI4UH_03845 [Dorea sp.]